MVGDHLDKRARESKSYEALVVERSTLTDLLLSMKLFLRKEEVFEDVTRFKLLRERVDKCAQGRLVNINVYVYIYICIYLCIY
jgi:hypothetical protein